VTELREHAQDLTNHLLTGFPSPRLQAAIDSVLAADGLIAVSPIFSASYSGLFKMFFDLIERDGLAGKPSLIGATGGTARHSLAIEHALRPLFAHLNAAVVATGVYAAAEDWGARGLAADGSLVERIDRAARELAAAMVARQHEASADPFESPTPFEQLLRSNPTPD
jgi:FMN reductase